MARIPSSLTVTVAAVLAALGGTAISAQDKYTVRVPNGLAFSEFRGYEDWQVVAVSQTEDRLKVIVANPAMIDAYRAGVPGNGRQFPDGSKTAKIEWNPAQNGESPLYGVHLVKRISLPAAVLLLPGGSGLASLLPVRHSAAPPCIRSARGGCLTNVPRAWADARPGGRDPSF